MRMCVSGWLQDIKPFDQALQVAMAVIIHLELFVTVRAVSWAQRSEYSTSWLAVQLEPTAAGC